MKSIVLLGFCVNVISPMSGPAGNWHSTCSLTLLLSSFVSKNVQTPILDFDLLRRYLHLSLDRVSAVAFAGNVLGKVSKQPKIV